MGDDGRTIELSEDEKRVDLVFKGGGVKGIALVGALEVLEAAGFRSQNVAGSSAGAVVAVLHAAGYSAAELHDIMQDLDFTDFLDKGWEDRLPGRLGQGLSIFLDQGIYEGTAFEEWMRAMLARKGRHTFADLVHPDFADDPHFRYRAQVVASDVTGRCFLVLPRDAHKLGIPPDELDIALAVRMSMSIPIFFEPVQIRHRETGEEHLIVDGGVLSNFPVWLFDTDGEPEWPTFGLLLVDPEPNGTLETALAPAPTDDGPAATLRYLANLTRTMLEAHDRMYLEAADFVRSIAVDNLGIGTTDFDLTAEQAEALYQSGRRAAQAFLADWDFDRYVEQYRSGAPRRPRRATVSEDVTPSPAPGRP